MTSVAIVGAGGHAKVVLATARAAGLDVSAVYDDDREKWGRELLGVRISGPCALGLDNRDATCILAIGANASRAKVARAARCRFVSIVHPAAIVHVSVTVEAGSVVFAGAVIQPDTTIGAHSIVNTGASIDHDCILGESVHVAPGARLAGAVTLEAEVLFGIGAVAIPGVRVGARTIVGAGAAVTHDIPADCVATGVPARARPLRR